MTSREKGTAQLSRHFCVGVEKGWVMVYLHVLVHPHCFLIVVHSLHTIISCILLHALVASFESYASLTFRLLNKQSVLLGSCGPWKFQRGGSRATPEPKTKVK